MLRLAHLSDLHVLSPGATEWRRILFNKRLTGHANLLRQRGRVYRAQYLQAVLAGAAAGSDHLVVTGDITNLSLEAEFEAATALLAEAARRVEVTVVPGNHDLYLPSIHLERRFPHHFGAYLRSDLEALACDLLAGPFPLVKLRGPAAIIGLSSAVPRPPFVAGGWLGEAQLRALERVLAHPEVARRTPVLLVHHPPVDLRGRTARWLDGLKDLRALQEVLAPVPRGLLLFGHLHRRVRCRLGGLTVVGASGAALDHPDPAVRAGFNAYRVEADGALAPPEAWVVAEDGGGLVPAPIPSREGCA